MPIIITATAAQSHAELQTLLNDIVTAINNVTGGETGLSATAYADLVAAKASLDTIKTALDELIDDHGTFKTVVDDIKTLVNDIRNKLLGDFVDNLVALAIGSDKEKVAHGEFQFHINGNEYNVDADAVGTALSGVDIPDLKAGAWALEINAAGAISIVEATDNATGYDSEALAIAGVPAQSADKARLGIVSLINNGGVFDPGTTLLDAITVSHVTYTDATPLLTTLGAAVSSSTPATLTAAKNTAMPAITTIGS